SGLIGHAKRPLHLLAAHAVTRRDKEVDRIEPLLQRRPAVLKDGPGTRIKIVAAMRAGKRLTVCELVKRRVFAAFPAYVAQSVTDFHNAGQASVIVRKFGEKLAN